MSINLCVETLNTTLQAIARQLELFAGAALRAAVDLRGSLAAKSFSGHQWLLGARGPVEFSELQATLLKVLLFLLLGTCLLIGYAWSVYGRVITEKFVRPSTLKEIEELKLSVAKLKLPKDHSPRI